MRERKEIRSQWFPIRLNEDEKKKLKLLYNRTTCTSLSEYARNVLLKEPVTVIYRNGTADDFLSEMIELKNELIILGKTFHEAVYQLHIHNHVPEMKARAIMYEERNKVLAKKTEQILEKLVQIHALWSQK